MNIFGGRSADVLQSLDLAAEGGQEAPQTIDDVTINSYSFGPGHR